MLRATVTTLPGVPQQRDGRARSLGYAARMRVAALVLAAGRGERLGD